MLLFGSWLGQAARQQVLSSNLVSLPQDGSRPTSPAAVTAPLQNAGLLDFLTHVSAKLILTFPR